MQTANVRPEPTTCPCMDIFERHLEPEDVPQLGHVSLPYGLHDLSTWLADRYYTYSENDVVFTYAAVPVRS